MYKDLKIWQKSMTILEEIYKISSQFPKSEDYNLTSQIRRAMVSVPLNIAEGKCRISTKDFAHFLNIASASLTEVEVILEIAKRLCYIKTTKEIENSITELNKMINSLRSKILNEN